MDWGDIKHIVINFTLERDALHIYIAFGVQVLASCLLRTGLGSFLPWLMVLVVALVNEALDVAYGRETSIQPWQVSAAAHDLLNTMLLPTALLLLVRYTPGLFEHRGRTPAGSELSLEGEQRGA